MGRGKKNTGGKRGGSTSRGDELFRNFINRAAPPLASSSTASGLAVPTHFSKDLLVSRHESFRSRLGAQISVMGDVCLFASTKSPQDEEEHKRAVHALSTLEPILLKDMRVDEVHLGRVLYGRLVVSPFRMSGVMSVMEDQAGYAMRVTIYELPQVPLDELFPSGCKVAIQEPYLRTCSDGHLAVRVDVPAHIIKVKRFPDATIPSAPGSLDFEGLCKLREEGNRYFTSKAWKKAIEMYSQCISAAHNNVQARSQVLLPALSNRAESWLKVENYDRALSDSNAALEIDGEHLKCLYRKGRALLGLQEHAAACQVLQKALDKYPGNADITDTLSKATNYQEQAGSGKFDISSYLMGGKPVPLTDYVGSVAVRAVAGRSEFGLFATSDMKVGDVIIVSNAMALVEGSTDRRIHDVFEDPVGEESTDEDRLELIDTVMKKVESSRRFGAQMRALATGDAGKDLAMFKPNGGLVPAGYVITDKDLAFTCDPPTIARLVSVHAVRSGVDVFMLDAAGFWVLPSMIRHSCVSNVSMLQCGSAMMVHAARDITSGEELTFALFDTLVPLAQREASRGYGRICDCARCSLEMSLAKPLRRITDKFSMFVTSSIVGSLLMQCGADRKELERLFVLVEDKIEAFSHLKTEEKTWLRAAYSSVYFSAAESLDMLMDNASPRVPSLIELVEVMQATVPGRLRAAKLITTASSMLLRYGRRAGDSNMAESLVDYPSAYKVYTTVFGRQEISVFQHLFVALANAHL